MRGGRGGRGAHEVFLWGRGTCSCVGGAALRVRVRLRGVVVGGGALVSAAAAAADGGGAGEPALHLGGGGRVVLRGLMVVGRRFGNF